MRRAWRCLVALLLLQAGHCLFAASEPIPALGRARVAEYDELTSQIQRHHTNSTALRSRLGKEAFRPEALIWDADRDPLDIVLRRTKALLADLGPRIGPDRLASETRALAGLQRAADAVPCSSIAERRDLFDRACQLRRRVAFANPLLQFDRLAFLTHHRARFEHMCDQYYGFHAQPGGSVYVLEDPFGAQPRLRDHLKSAVLVNGRRQGQPLTGGSFVSLEVDWDAQRLYFAWTPAAPTVDRWSPESTYHLFSLRPDGTDLRQLTDGAWNDFDPCVLPDGRVAFVSERRGGYLRCGGPRLNPTYTLHAMNADGGSIVPLSLHETHEWHPSVDHQGMIVFTRWDYVDRDSDIAHHLWQCRPDGSDPRSSHGNYPTRREDRPWMEMSLRAIPGSHRLVGVAAPHHGQAYGSLVVIDPRVPDDGAMSQVRRLTPDVPFPEAEAPYRPAQIYGTPWPLSEDYYLCVYDPQASHYAIYLIDSFGNREQVWLDADVACLDPIPLAPRTRPPVLSPPLHASPSLALADRGSAWKTAYVEPAEQRPATARTDVVPPPQPLRGAAGEGVMAVMNVYESAAAWPAGTKIRALRVIQIFPKTTVDANLPNIGAGNQALGRGVLGTAPVEADGSAWFIVPAEVPIYLQALDEQGLAVQSMRSDTYVHAGQVVTCQGCHESKHRAPPSRTDRPLAFLRSPSRLTPAIDGAYPLTFPRLVQPVLDRRCVDCHQREPKACDLSGTTAASGGWSKSFESLWPLGYFLHGGNGWIQRIPGGGSRSEPGQVGARASRLYALLAAGHYGVNLPSDEMARLTLWLDANCNFYGVYHDLTAQSQGKAVAPILE